MSQPDPDHPEVRRRIAELRAEVRLRDGRPNDGRCGHVAEALEAEFGWRRRSGYLLLQDRTVSWVHCWNQLDDGRIVDATADQFQELWIGELIMIEATSPLHSHYLAHPREWQLRPASGEVERPPTVTCRSDDDVRVLPADDLDRPWTALARSVLLLLTGWQVHDQIVDLAARILWARAETATELTSAEFVHPLVIQSIQHLGGLRHPAWIAPEFSQAL